MNIDPQDRLICAGGDLEEEPPDTPGPASGGSPPASRPASTPIYQSSLFTFPEFGDLLDGFGAEHRTNLYSRGK
ncbi:MAG: hypothetical protein ACWGON_07735, partial [Gemmatimonadota bacterium]